MHHFHLIILSSALFGALLCFAATGTETSPATADQAGIEGVITVGPTGGPVRDDQPSSVGLTNVTLLVLRGTDPAGSVKTDEEGRFRLALPPGHYRVEVAERQHSRIGRYGPFEVDVVAGKMTEVKWQCDSGMR
ncbi:MAG: carboxypeptidase-like regulatory domain-containing protein [Chthoniobacterales bacterium]